MGHPRTQETLETIIGMARGAGKVDTADRARDRTCDGCSVCCVVHDVKGVTDAETPCDHLCEGGVGCGIYGPEMPDLCAVYFCAWRAGLVAGGDELRPDRCGVIADIRMSAETRPGNLPMIHVRQAEAGADVRPVMRAVAEASLEYKTLLLLFVGAVAYGEHKNSNIVLAKPYNPNWTDYLADLDERDGQPRPGIQPGDETPLSVIGVPLATMGEVERARDRLEIVKPTPPWRVADSDVSTTIHEGRSCFMLRVKLVTFESDGPETMTEEEIDAFMCAVCEAEGSVASEEERNEAFGIE